MAYISEQYDDERILEALKAARPELNLGDRVRVTNVDAPLTASNQQHVVEVTLAFTLDGYEWRRVLDAARI
jgi:hypothetical protein